MRQTTDLSFERIVDEFARWRAVPEPERSPAPAWWWGPAFEALERRRPMPAEWCASLGLPDHSPVAAGAGAILTSLSNQTLLPWTGNFPFAAHRSDPK